MILPLVKEFFLRLEADSALDAALTSLRWGRRAVSLAGLTPTAKSLAVALVARSLGRPVFFLVESNRAAENYFDALRFFYSALTGKAETRVGYLPAHDVLPYQELSPHPEIAEARAVTLARLTAGQLDLVVTPAVAARMRLREPEFYSGLSLSIEKDQELPLENLVKHLTRVGYERQELVEMAGRFSVRGGIVDVFSPESRRPVRLELFGDTVESLREFDPATQRSVGPVERAAILPLTDYPIGPEASEATGGEGLPLYPGWEFRLAAAQSFPATLLAQTQWPVVVLDEPGWLDEIQQKFFDRLGEDYRRAGGDGATAVPPRPEQLFLTREEWERELGNSPRLELEQLPLEREPRPEASGDQGEPGKLLVWLTQPTTKFRGAVKLFVEEVRGKVQRGERVAVAAGSMGEMERMADLMREYQLPYRVGSRGEDAASERLAEESVESYPAALLFPCPVGEGAAFPASGLTFYGSHDLFEAIERARKPVRPKSKTTAFLSDFRDLKIGDHVVHADHGIGQFQGLRQIEHPALRGEVEEFMLLLYQDDARLYVPLARLDLIQKYSNLEGTRPPLDRLGGVTWARTKARIRRSMQEMAEALLKLYAGRKLGEGHAFSPDTSWQREFEAAFDFEETPDQLAAIADAKRDMERPQPMDRLVVGDVGYGKTEVAMRAAFKAIQDNRQVALLAPTTILAFQHYQTFRERMAAFPVEIEMLSRFRKPAEQKRILEALEAGKVDIVIGTHRLLSGDVRFSSLGLLIVDEEQRFGVAAKERLKQLKKDVDVLTLSATPIPRTLQMSLAGLRDLSVIETPPKDRLAIQTVVTPFRESLLQLAIEQELQRGGQVYFVHNRVQSIHAMVNLVRKLVPQARLGVAHGQMSERELERTMLRFIQHEFDVLVATTIIENGLDIPLVNTIVINRADRLGLAELYQLRGRVGRSNRRAYAYLLVPQESALGGLARKRLAALREFSELGAGFRLAALDLELRGGGNLLGREQHGHIQALGFEMYCQMLERTVQELKGLPVAPEFHTSLQLGLDIRIPPEYVPEESHRLRLYKKIAAVRDEADRRAMEQELVDSLGAMPPSVRNLLHYAVLRAECERLRIVSVERQAERISIKFHTSTPIAPDRLVEVVRKSTGARLEPSGVLRLEWPHGAGTPLAGIQNVLRQLQPQD